MLFAGTALADQRDHFARRHIERDALQDLVLAASFAQRLVSEMSDINFRSSQRLPRDIGKQRAK